MQFARTQTQAAQRVGKWCAALFLSLLLVATLVPTALFQSKAYAVAYSITITNSTVGHTYEAYQVLDATYDSNGNVAYTIDIDSPWFSTVKNSGLFTMYRIGSTDVYSVVIDADDEDIVDYFQQIAGDEDATSASVIENAVVAGSTLGTGASVSIPVEEAGYYYVTSTLGAVVTLTTARPTATVIDKNQDPGFRDGEGKFVYDEINGWSQYTDLSVGDSAEFKITASVPMYDHKQAVSTYVLADNPPDSMTLDASSTSDIEVSFTNNGTDVTSKVSYQTSFVYSGGNPATVIGYKVTIDVANSPDYPTNDDTKIEVTYSATLNSQAEAINTNVAKLTWTKANGDPGDGDEDDADVYTYGFDLIKRADSTTGDVLYGAEFKLYPTEESADAIWFTTDENGNYIVAAVGFTPTSTAGMTQTLTAGEVKVFGLAAGTYYLEENLAPDGYNPLDERAAVEIAENTESGDGYVATANVVNNAGSELPSTGGAGTTALYIAGGVLVIAAVAAYLFRRTRSAKERWFIN